MERRWGREDLARSWTPRAERRCRVTGFSITNIRSTIYSAFHMGLMIGMEMNAAELTSAADGRAPQKEGA